MKKLLLLAFILLVLNACGTTSQPAGSTAPTNQTIITLDAQEFSFTPARFETSVGQPITIKLHNKGLVLHDFTITKLNVAGEVQSSGDEHADHGSMPMTDHMSGTDHMNDMPMDGHMMSGAAATVHVAVNPNGDGSVTFTPTQAGTYEFECTVVGHKQAGMVGQLVVK